MTDPETVAAGSAPSAFRLGTRRGLEACASARGTFAVLALDHRQNLRKELHPAAPETTTYDEMVAFKQRGDPRAGAACDRVAARPGDRRRAVHRGRVAARPAPGSWSRSRPRATPATPPRG